jgi:glycerol-3-phosphate cytidylyltransferase-like family protein
VSARDKVFAEDQLADLLASHRRAGRRVVLFVGAFDGLRARHARALEEAAALGGVLAVAVKEDEPIRRAKGDGHPRHPAAERAEVVAALACVDYVTRTADDGPERLLRALRPDVYAKGPESDVAALPERGVLDALGIEVHSVGDAALGAAPPERPGRRGGGDRVLPHPDATGFVTRAGLRRLSRAGWLDPARFLATEEGAVVHRHRDRFVRRLEIGGHAVYAKVHRPMARGRSAIVEGQNALALRAAGFAAPQPWLAVEGRGEEGRFGVLVTREAKGLALSEHLALALEGASPRAYLAEARGLGEWLRALHTARFYPRDLLAWHVFVDGTAAAGPDAITLVDVERVDRGGARFSRRKAVRGLAALRLSTGDAAPPRFALAVLRAYLGGTLRAARPWIRAIRARAQRLRSRGTFAPRAPGA